MCWCVVRVKQRDGELCAVVLEHLRLLCSCVSAIASYVVLSSAIWKVVLSFVNKCCGRLSEVALTSAIMRFIYIAV